MQSANGEIQLGNGVTGIMELPNTVSEGARPPVVLMLHGHSGNRSEAGRFDRAAAQHLAAGIAVLRIDMQSTIATRLGAARAALAHLASRTDVDPTRIGVLGYSWGGLIAAYLVGAGSPPVRAAVLWNPVVSVDPLVDGPGQIGQRRNVVRLITGGEPDRKRAGAYGIKPVHVGGGHTFDNTDPAATASTVQWFTERL